MDTIVIVINKNLQMGQDEWHSKSVVRRGLKSGLCKFSQDCNDGERRSTDLTRQLDWSRYFTFLYKRTKKTLPKKTK